MMKKNERLITAVAVVALTLMLSGCMSRQYVEKRTFALDVSRGETVTGENEAILRVRTFRASPRYEGKKFVYRGESLSYESDFYNEFLTSPDTMITEEVRQWLADSGLFQQVVGFSGQVQPTHILEGTITDLYGDFSERGSPPRAALQMEFYLSKDIAGRSETVFNNRYRHEARIQRDSPEELIQGWNKALARILTDFEEDLREIDLTPGQ
jgi:cholesterol transport system auxiliary component